MTDGFKLASRWNFAFFTSGGGNEESKLGSVRAVQMEFETTVSDSTISMCAMLDKSVMEHWLIPTFRTLMGPKDLNLAEQKSTSVPFTPHPPQTH